MAKLRNFQMATAERIMEYYKGDNNHRYLLADEVGLGKTIVASEVIERFAQENEKAGQRSAVYYVCGNLALVAQNEKKLLNDCGDYREYQKNDAKKVEMTRLVLSFIQQNYLENFESLVNSLKAVAMWMLVQGEDYTNEKFYCKDKKTIRVGFVKKHFLLNELFLKDSCDLKVSQRLEKENEVFRLLLDIYEKIKVESYDKETKDIVKIINELEGIDVQKAFGEYEHQLTQKYDELINNKRVIFQSLTNLTSIQKKSNGTWIERTAAGIVYYKWLALNSDEKRDSIFEKQMDDFLIGTKNIGEEVFSVIRKGEYWERLLFENYYRPEMTLNAITTMFLYQNITDSDVQTIMEKVGNPKSFEKAKDLLKAIMKSMSVYSLERMKYNRKVLVIVDEFQNYSQILGNREDDEENIKIKEELLHKTKETDTYVLLMSATPFHYRNANAEKNTMFKSELKEIDSEVDMVLEYVMGKEEYEKWLVETDEQKKYELLYKNGVSRTERNLEGHVENGCMTLSYENGTDFELLKSDIQKDALLSDFEETNYVCDGDLIILYRAQWYLYRQQNQKVYVAPYENVDEIVCGFGEELFEYFEFYDEEEKKNQKTLFFKCYLNEDELFDYDSIDVPKREEQSILKKIDLKNLPISYVKDTPWILSFTNEYKTVKVTSKNEEWVVKGEKLNSYSELTTNHARFNKIKKLLLEENNTYKLLYIPPSKPDYNLWGIYEAFDNASEEPIYYSKTLFFSRNYHTPRSLATMLSYESERLNKTLEDRLYNDRIRYDLNGQKWEEKKGDEINKKLIKTEIERYFELKKSLSGKSPYIECIKKDNINREEDCFCLGSIAGYFIDLFDLQEDSVKEWNFVELLSAIYSVFTTREAYNILSTIKAETYADKIFYYCAQGNFRSVLDEYVHLIFEAENIMLKKMDVTKIIKKMHDGYFDIIASFMNRNYKIQIHTSDLGEVDVIPNFAQGITGDDNTDKKTLKNKLICFNSPFRPFVFATTSVGAEGLDFHWFCRNIYHWSVEMNPEKFQQKEGRINRFHCHSVRQNLARDFGQKGWDDIYNLERNENDDPLWPDWIYTGQDEKGKYAKLTRNTCYYPKSYEDAVYEEMINNVEIYRKIIAEQYLCPYYQKSEKWIK